MVHDGCREFMNETPVKRYSLSQLIFFTYTLAINENLFNRIAVSCAGF